LAPSASAPSASDLQQLKTMTLGLAATLTTMRDRVDQLAAGQKDTANEIAKLQATEQEIQHKIAALTPRPAAAPASKSTPPAPPRRRTRPPGRPPGPRPPPPPGGVGGLSPPRPPANKNQSARRAALTSGGVRVTFTVPGASSVATPLTPGGTIEGDGPPSK